MQRLLVIATRQQLEHVALRMGFRRLMAGLELDLLMGPEITDRMKLE
jgi:hypothetical protein